MSAVDELRVSGGIGGVSARLEDIEQVGRLLRSVGDRLGDTARHLAAVSIAFSTGSTAPWSPLTFARAEAALFVSGLGPAGLVAAAARTGMLGSGAVSAAAMYRAGDAAADLALRTALTVVGETTGATVRAVAPGLVPAAVTVVTVVAARVGGEARAFQPSGPLRRLGIQTLRLLGGSSRLVGAGLPFIAATARGLTDTPGGRMIWTAAGASRSTSTTVADAVGALGLLGRLAGAATGRPRWLADGRSAAASVGPARAASPPAGLGELVGRIPGAPDGPQIHVERLTRAGGRRHWVVSIPGTSQWSPAAGATPFDLSGNVKLMSAGRSAGVTATLEALRASGIRPGEPVLLAGHSQGGMIAAALAADPAVRREFAITHLFTIGAPIASTPIPPEVQVLAVEHDDDLVPALDGVPNRDATHWITVQVKASTAGLPAADLVEPLIAHGLPAYRNTAEAIEVSTDQSLRAWQAGAATFFAAPGTSGSAWDVTVARTSADRAGERP